MNSRAAVLETLLNSSAVWRGGETARVEARSTGYSPLDALLPSGGWPVGTLIEISPQCEGLGELTLSLPALRSWCAEGRPVAFVQPPHIPYAPALMSMGLPLKSVLWITAGRDVDARWAAEQLLREGAAAVLLWGTAREDRDLKRLQLAAEAGKACAFLYRSPATLTHASPAAVRIALSPTPGDGTQLELVKVRGGRPGKLVLPLQCFPT